MKEIELPANVGLTHFNAVSGLNNWEDAALVIIIGRTEPSPADAEKQARLLFRREVIEIEGWYSKVQRVIRMRDGNHAAVMNSQHPDTLVEAVRWSICEAELLQDIGRPRGINRTAANPAHVLLLTDVCLPVVVDQVATWEDAQPSLGAIMAARGVRELTSYRECAIAFPDLFPSEGAAKKALTRENRGQTPNAKSGAEIASGPADETRDKLLIDKNISIRSLSLVFRYRRQGARGPAVTLEYDPLKIPDPEAFLNREGHPPVRMETADV